MLHYNYFRDYDPAVGRYLQSDPIGLAGGANTFAYAHLDPVRNADPSGLFAIFMTPGKDEPGFGLGVMRPGKVPGMYACNARCAMLPTGGTAASCPVNDCSGFVMGYGKGTDLSAAKKAARADANKRVPLGCQLKHCTYACTDPKGGPIYPIGD